MPKPGPHSLSRSLPLLLIVRNILKFAKTAKEARNIISKEKIIVDGKVRRDERFLVGLMDVISIVGAKKSYRVLPYEKGLFLHPIDSSKATFKLCRIENKTIVKSGHVHLDLHDGSTYLIQVSNPQNPEEDVYHTLDVLKLSVSDRELLGHIKLDVGAVAIVIGGKNIGKYGKVVSIEKKPSKKRRDLLVAIKDVNGDEFQTILDFVFILGGTESAVSLPEVH
jgi:small subunit ribosomal protein S4e